MLADAASGTRISTQELQLGVTSLAGVWLWHGPIGIAAEGEQPPPKSRQSARASPLANANTKQSARAVLHPARETLLHRECLLIRILDMGGNIATLLFLSMVRPSIGYNRAKLG